MLFKNEKNKLEKKCKQIYACKHTNEKISYMNKYRFMKFKT